MDDDMDALSEIDDFGDDEVEDFSPITRELDGQDDFDGFMSPTPIPEGSSLVDTPGSPDFDPPFLNNNTNIMNSQQVPPAPQHPQRQQPRGPPQFRAPQAFPVVAPPNQTRGPPMNAMQRPIFKTYNVQGDIFKLTSRYTLKYLIGSGAYGIVCSGVDEVKKQKVAIKKVPNLFHQSREFQKRIFREIKLLQHFNHENIIGLIDLVPPMDYPSFREVYFVFELMDTDLRQIIDSKQKLTEDHIQFFLYQILKAVKYIHSASVLHRDLKPENILLNSDCDLKICDFGLARGVNFEMLNPVMSTPYVATRYYRAPELLCMWSGCSKAIDMWSVGCIFAELLNRKPLFKGRNYLHQIQLIINLLGTPHPNEIKGCPKAKHYISTLRRKQPIDLKFVFPNASRNALNLLSKMLTFDPVQRITVEEALKHPFLENFHEPEDEPTCEKFDFTFENMLLRKNIDMKGMIFRDIMEWFRMNNQSPPRNINPRNNVNNMNMNNNNNFFPGPPNNNF